MKKQDLYTDKVKQYTGIKDNGQTGKSIDFFDVSNTMQVSIRTEIAPLLEELEKKCKSVIFQAQQNLQHEFEDDVVRAFDNTELGIEGKIKETKNLMVQLSAYIARIPNRRDENN